MKRFVCIVMAFIIALSVCGALPFDTYAAADGECIAVSDILFANDDGEYILGLPDANKTVTASAEVSLISGEAKEAFMWIAKYNGDEMTDVKIDRQALTKKTSFSVSLTTDASTDAVKAGIFDNNMIPICAHKANASIVKEKGGKISDVKMNGVSTTAVYGAPMLCVNPTDLYSRADSDSARITAVKSLGGTLYDTNKYMQYGNRSVAGGFVNDDAGYAFKFVLAHKKGGKSIFDSEGVTRLWKSDTDFSSNTVDFSKIYEFDINKSATVYITMSKSSYSVSNENLTSNNIENLNAGWKKDYDADKYGVYRLTTKEISNNGKTVGVPTGGVTAAWGTSGTVYYKHFNAGEHVEIPAVDTPASSDSDAIRAAAHLRCNIFVVWDALDASDNVFDILVNGKSLNGFSNTKYAYTYNYALGSDIPTVDVSAAAGANITVEQATKENPKAVIKSGNKTYTITFAETVPNMELKSLKVDGTSVDGFDASVKEYAYTIERGVTVMPKVSAEAAEADRTVEISQVQKIPGKAVVNVKASNGYTVSYTINFTKPGSPGAVTNLKSARGDAVYAVPSLGAEPVDHWSMYETDAERAASAVDPNSNPYWDADGKWAQYTDRSSGTAWKNYDSWSDSYGGSSEFILLDVPSSVLISSEVTRIYKPTYDKTGEGAESAYTFNISKGATVYITTQAASDFIQKCGWEYEFNNKYKIYSSAYKLAEASDGKKYRILTGSPSTATAANGTVYKKHFNKDELVAVPAFSKDASYKQTNIFVVWDECNDEKLVYGAEYTVDGQTYKMDGFNITDKKYDITLPSSVKAVPQINVISTGAVKTSVTNPTEYVNGKTTAKVSINTEGVDEMYEINFYIDAEAEKDIRLKSISFDGEAYDKFNTYTREYAVELPFGKEYPTVTAQALRDVTPTPSIEQPTDANNGKCKITVVSSDGTVSAVYTITFTKLDYIPATAEIMPIKDGKKSIVTIVHDDGYLDTVKFLNDEFAKNNLNGTIAMIARNVNASNKAQWQAELDKGRLNIANHSYTHNYWGQTDEAESGTLKDGSNYSIAAGNMTYEIVKSGEYLRSMFPKERVLCFVKPGFSYPDGKPQVSTAAYEMIGKNYICMRNTGGGIETVPAADKYNLKSLMVQANDSYSSSENHTAAYWKDEVDKTIDKNGWLIFLFHGIVDDSNASGLSVAKSKASILFDYLGEKSATEDVWNAQLDEATLYTEEVKTASVVAKDYTQGEGRMELSVTDKLDDDIYDYPLTIKVKVPSDWDYVKTVQNGTSAIKRAVSDNGDKYVYADVVPDKGTASLTKADVSKYISQIKIGENPLTGFDATKTHYSVELGYGSVSAPEITVDCPDGVSAEINQATLTDGEGSGFVNLAADGVKLKYEIHFSTAKKGPVVFLKLDDLREGNTVRNAMKNAIGYTDKVGVKANIGVIAVSLESGDESYYTEIKNFAANGHEIWSHGYYHNSGAGTGITEFRSSYEDQLKYMQDSLAIINEKCGITVTSFGAPGNATNATPQIKATFFGPAGAENAVDLSQSMNFEIQDSSKTEWATMLDYKNFVKEYEANKNKAYLVLQGHPGCWATDASSTHFKIFRDQIDYLIANGAVFMTATDYAEALSK